jgi:hypothetical protein
MQGRIDRLREEQRRIGGDHFEPAIRRLEEELAARKERPQGQGRPEKRQPAVGGEGQNKEAPNEKQAEDQHEKFRRLAEKGRKEEKKKDSDEGRGFGSIVIGGIVVAVIVGLLYAFRRQLLRGFREKRSDKLPSAFDVLRHA